MKDISSKPREASLLNAKQAETGHDLMLIIHYFLFPDSIFIKIFRNKSPNFFLKPCSDYWEDKNIHLRKFKPVFRYPIDYIFILDTDNNGSGHF